MAGSGVSARIDRTDPAERLDLARRLQAIAASCAVAGLAVVGLTWTDSFGMASAYVVCIGIGLGTWTPIAWGIIQEVAPPEWSVE